MFVRLEDFATIQSAQHVAGAASAVVLYLLTGEQCLETPGGAMRAHAGEGMVASAETPMQLNIMGSSSRDAFFMVMHDASKARVAVAEWQPRGLCVE